MYNSASPEYRRESKHESKHELKNPMKIRGFRSSILKSKKRLKKSAATRTSRSTIRTLNKQAKQEEKIMDEYREQKDEKGKINFLAKLKKRTRNRKKVKYISKNRDVIKQLMKDMKSRPKFGKLVSFSITCLTNLCVNEVSCEEMIDCGVLEVLERVLKLNPYNEDLRRLINMFLQKAGINADMISLLSDKLPGQHLVTSLQTHLHSKTLISTCDTMHHLMNKKFTDKLVKHRIDTGLSKVLKRNNIEQAEAKEKKGDLAAACTRVANKLITVQPKHAHLLLESGVMAGILKSMQLHPKHELLNIKGAQIIALLSQINPKWAEQLKENGAVRVLVKSTDNNPYHGEILRITGTALKVLGTGAELSKAIDSLKKHDSNSNAMATVGALALVDENVDVLIKKGGVKLITTMLKQLLQSNTLLTADKKRFLLNAARALGRMANDEQNIFEIIKNRGAQILLNAMTKHFKDPEIVAACVSTLSQLASRKENCEYLLKLGCLKAISAAIKKHSKDRIIALQSIDMMENMCKTKDLSLAVMNSEAFGEVFTIMKTHKEDKEVILRALKFLDKLAKEQGSIALKRIRGHGGLYLIANTLKDHKKDKILVKAALSILEVAAKDKASLETLKKAGALNLILGVVKEHKKDQEILKLATNVAGILISPKDIKRYLEEMKDLHDRVGMMDLTALAELLPLANLMAGLSSVPENLTIMMKANAANIIGEGITALEALPSTTETNKVLQSLYTALSNLSKAEGAAAEILKLGYHKPILDHALLKKDEKMAEIATEIMKQIAAQADEKDVHEIEEDGSIDQVAKLSQIFEDNDIILGNAQFIFQACAEKKSEAEKDLSKLVQLTLSSLDAVDSSEKAAEGIEYLLKMSDENNDSLPFMIAQEAYKTLIDLAQEYSNDANVVDPAMTLLSKLAAEDDDLYIAYAQMDIVSTGCRTVRKLFNVPPVVKKGMVLLKKISDKKDAIEYFLGNGTAKLIAWAAKAYAVKDPEISKAAISILQKLHDEAENESYMLGLAYENELKLQEAEKKRILEEKRAKLAPKKGSDMNRKEMDFLLQNIEIQDADPEILGDLIGLIGIGDNNLDLFVDAGGLAMMSDIILDPNTSEDAFNQAVLCFDAGLVANGGKLVNLKADRKVLDALMQVMSLKRVEKYDFGVDKLENSMNTVLEVSGSKDVLVDLLKDSDLSNALLKIVGAASEPGMLIPTMKMLARITNLKEQALKLANAANIEALIKAMKANMDKPDFLKFAAHLLGNLALNTHLQNLIGELTGVQVVLNCIKKYDDSEDLVDKCCYCLRMCSNKNSVNAALMIRYETPKMVVQALRDHSEASTRFYLNTIGILLNLAKTNSGYAEIIVKCEGDLSVVETMYTNMDQDMVLKFCMQTLLKLIQPKTANLLLEHSVIHAINPCLDRNDTKQDVVVAAIKVFQRLARHASKDPEAMAIILSENAHKSMVKCISRFGENAGVMVPALDCLAIFSRDPHTSNVIVRMGIVDTIAEGIGALSYDEHFCNSAISLLERLSQNPANLSTIANSNIAREMSDCIDTYPDSKELIQKYMLASSRVCAIPQFADKVALWIIPRVIRATHDFVEDVPVLKDCMKCLVSLTQSSRTAFALSKKACAMAKMLIKTHHKDVPFLINVLKFLSSLFLQVRAAEEGIIQTLIMQTLQKRLARAPDELVTHRVLDTLYNAAISTNTVKKFMKENNVITSLEDCKLRWQSYGGVVANCEKVKKAILTPKIDFGDIGKMLNRPDEALLSARERFGQGDEDEKYKLPTRYRNFLTSGEMVKMHHGGLKKCENKHLQVKRDLKRLLWSDPQNPTVKKSMAVYRLRRVKAGLHTPTLSKMKKGGYKTKHPFNLRCFSVHSEDIMLSFECSSESLRNKWVRALEALIKYNKSSHQFATERLIQ
mmetsp:Transcript_8412/g.12619  ORF Transcript_8412/g.12619 Transcript_8412/m.12619 type:complete len:1909 (+) Transcript_8412:75-5801(+)